jgi:hypothetical protein
MFDAKYLSDIEGLAMVATKQCQHGMVTISKPFTKALLPSHRHRLDMKVVGRICSDRK